jgi:hypothetical protein
MLRQKQIEQPRSFRLFSQLMHQRLSCPSLARLSDLSFHNRLCRYTFCFYELVYFLDLLDGDWGELGLHPGRDPVECGVIELRHVGRSLNEEERKNLREIGVKSKQFQVIIMITIPRFVGCRG